MKNNLEMQHVLNHLSVLLGGMAKYTGLMGQVVVGNSPRSTALAIAWHFLGTPYRWGGDDPIAGMDCSGLVVEILQSVNIVYEDYTANGLWELFTGNNCQVKDPRDGCLVFWAKFPTHRNPATHVEMCLNDTLSIGASGGGSRIRTIQDAIDQNAYVKVRPFVSRRNLKGFVDPFKMKKKGD